LPRVGPVPYLGHMTHARFLRRQAAMRHGEQRPLTRDEIAQIPPERLRAIVAAGLVQAAMREVAQIEARLLQDGHGAQ